MINIVPTNQRSSETWFTQFSDDLFDYMEDRIWQHRHSHAKRGKDKKNVAAATFSEMMKPNYIKFV